MNTASFQLNLLLSNESFGAQVELEEKIREVVSEAIANNELIVDNIEVIDFDISIKD